MRLPRMVLAREHPGGCFLGVLVVLGGLTESLGDLFQRGLHLHLSAVPLLNEARERHGCSASPRAFKRTQMAEHARDLGADGLCGTRGER